MDEIIRDNLWQIVASVIALIAIVVAICIYLLQKQRKKFSYEVIATTSLLSVAEEVESKVKIIYEDKPVKRVHLFEISLINTGNVPILESDFNRPISIVFDENAKILSAEISEENPKKLDAEIEFDDNNIKLAPILLNPGDSVTIKSLISEYNKDFTIDGRIVGVKEINKRVERNIEYIFKYISIGFFLTAIVIGIYNLLQNGATVANIVFFVILIGMIIATLSKIAELIVKVILAIRKTETNF